MEEGGLTMKAVDMRLFMPNIGDAGTLLVGTINGLMIFSAIQNHEDHRIMVAIYEPPTSEVVGEQTSHVNTPPMAMPCGALRDEAQVQQLLDTLMPLVISEFGWGRYFTEKLGMSMDANIGYLGGEFVNDAMVN